MPVDRRGLRMIAKLNIKIINRETRKSLLKFGFDTT